MTTEESFRWEAKWETTMQKIKNLMFQDIGSLNDPIKKRKSLDKKS